jgi:hypothetical protein
MRGVSAAGAHSRCSLHSKPRRAPLMPYPGARPAHRWGFPWRARDAEAYWQYARLASDNGRDIV